MAYVNKIAYAYKIVCFLGQFSYKSLSNNFFEV